MKPVFSIITPTFNRGYCIWKEIQSVQKQTFPDWEMIIVDDGSTDDTKKVVAEFQNDPRIKYFETKHKNASSARNIGLKLAKGRFISYVDSDDIIYENYLAVAFEYFIKYPHKMFAVCNCNRRLELYDKNYKLIDFTDVSSSQKQEVSLQDFYHWKVKTCGSGIFHKNISNKEYILWDEKITMLEDLDFLMQLGKKYPKGFLHIPYVLFEYLQKYGGDSLCSKISYQDMAKFFEIVYQKHKNDPLMKGQKWYPARVEKYKKLQKEFEEGRVVPPEYRYFPKYYKP